MDRSYRALALICPRFHLDIHHPVFQVNKEWTTIDTTACTGTDFGAVIAHLCDVKAVPTQFTMGNRLYALFLTWIKNVISHPAGWLNVEPSVAASDAGWGRFW